MCSTTDDVVVSYDDDGSDHDRNVWQVLKTACHECMKFNPDKCMFCCKAIPFFRMILSREGMLPDPRKSENLVKLPFPSTVKEMHSFFGMVSYLRRFTKPTLASLTTPLRQLVKKSNAYTPMPHHQVAFQAIIGDMCKETILRYYNQTQT